MYVATQRDPLPLLLLRYDFSCPFARAFLAGGLGCRGGGCRRFCTRRGRCGLKSRHRDGIQDRKRVLAHGERGVERDLSLREVQEPAARERAIARRILNTHLRSGDRERDVTSRYQRAVEADRAVLIAPDADRVQGTQRAPLLMLVVSNQNFE